MRFRPVAKLASLTVLFLTLLGCVRTRADWRFEFAASEPFCSEVEGETSRCSWRDLMALEASEAGYAWPFKILELRDAGSSKVYLSSMRFSGKTVARRWCPVFSEGATATAFLDRITQEGSQVKHLRKRCGARPQQIRFLGPSLGPKTRWGLYHMKFLVVESLGGPNLIQVGTANQTRAAHTVNYEYWIRFEVLPQSQLAQQHSCLIRALLALPEEPQGRYRDYVGLFRNQLELCREAKSLLGFREALAREKIAAWFVPGPEGDPRPALLERINRSAPSSFILVSSQYFTEARLAKALVNAANRGVNVRVLLDDDAVRSSDMFSRYSVYAPILRGSKVATKVVVTNHELWQYYHQKYIVFGESEVFFGSGQLSDAGFELNFENYYISSRPDLVRQFRALFESMWQRAKSPDIVLADGSKH